MPQCAIIPKTKLGEILDDPMYLCYDMIHPSDFGNIQMSQNLVNEIKKIR